jgi:hypothetical protein
VVVAGDLDADVLYSALLSWRFCTSLEGNVSDCSVGTKDANRADENP